MNQLDFGKEKLPSVVKDPFSKNTICDIWVRFSPKLFSSNNTWEAIGWVEFQNGNTKGRQDFKGETFDDVVRQIKAMIETL